MRLAIAKAVLGIDAPNYMVDLRAGTHGLLGDEGPHAGGLDRGPAPFEFVLAGLAACTATTLKMYIQRKGWLPGRIDVEVELHVERDVQYIRRVVSIGLALDDSQQTRLAEICEKTPVTLFIKRGTRIETSLRT